MAQNLVEIPTAACQIGLIGRMNDRLHARHRLVTVTGVYALRYDLVNLVRQSLVRCGVYLDDDCRSVDCHPGLNVI